MIHAIGRIVLPLAVVATGIGITALLIDSREEPQSQMVEDQPPLVRTIRAELHPRRPQIHARGEVEAPATIAVSSRVGGFLVTVPEAIDDGNLVAAGDLLASIDAADYRSAVDRAAAELREAELALAREVAQATQAEREWQRLGEGEADPLVVRGPQLAAARATVAAATAALAQAERQVAYCTIRAPVAGRIRSRPLEPGRQIAAGTVVAEILPTLSVEIRTALRLEEAALLDLPLRGERDHPGLPVTVHATVPGLTQQWSGRVVRTAPVVDRRTRSLDAVVRVADPLAGDNPLPLLPGMFVRISIEGPAPRPMAEVPASSLQDDDRLLVVDDEDLIRAIPVRIEARTGDTVWVSGDVADRFEVVADRLIGAATGDRIRRRPSENATTEPAP